MAKLALAAGDGALFSSGNVMLPLDRRTGEAAARAGRETVLVYSIVPKTLVTFLGRGRVAALNYPEDSSTIICMIDRYEAFATPEVSTVEAAMPRARFMLALGDERFSEIVERGTGPLAPPLVQEAHALFVDTYVTIRDQVLEAWNYCCAVTGTRFAPRSARSRLEVIAIRPRAMGGPLHVRNCLPLIASAAKAWDNGWIAAGPRLDILAVQNRLDADLLEQMRPEGTLLVPDHPDLAPDPQHIGYHREHIFAH